MSELTLLAGCGYLGTFIARELLQTGRPVLALTRHRESAEALDSEDIPAVACDLTVPDSLATAASKLPPSTSNLRIVHCAASGKGGGALQYRAVYLEGCRNLRNAFPQARRFFFTSSTSVYPQVQGEVVTEKSPAGPPRETGRILRETEEETLAAGGMAGRLAGIYGPGRSILLKNFLEQKSLIDVRREPPATPDGRWVNQIHVQDAARAIIHLLDLEPLPSFRIWNICDSHPFLQRPLYTRLSDQFHLPIPPEAPPDHERKRGWTHKQVSNQRLLETGWKPLYPSWFDALDAGAIFPEAAK